MAASLLALALGRLTLAQLYTVALVEGTFNVFFNLAETAALTRVVTRDQIPAATSLDEVTLSTGSMLGPALGGLVFALGQGLAFLVDAVSYAVSGRLGPADSRGPERRAVGAREQPLVRDARRRGLALASHADALPRAHRRRHGADRVGLYTDRHHPGAAHGRLGGGHRAGARRGRRRQPCRRAALGADHETPTFGQIALGVHWIWALLLPLFVIAPNPLALAAITTATYGITPIFFVAQYSYRLSLIPDSLQARANSVFRLLLFGGQPLGLALAGVLSQSLGPTSAVLVFSALLVLLALAITLNRELRTAGKIAEVSLPD